MTFRVKDWTGIYENNRSRELKKTDWVPVPNRMDGDGYTELMAHQNAAAHFGAWLAIIQIASKCEPRGTLLRDGARAHDASSLSRISRIPSEVFEEAIPRFLDIGWLEPLNVKEFKGLRKSAKSQEGAGSPHPSAGLPQEGATKPQEGAASRARKEQNGMEQNGMEPPSSAGADGTIPFPPGPTKPPTEDELLTETAKRMVARHPPNRRCTVEQAKARLKIIIGQVPKSERAQRLCAIDANHQAWCESEQWQKDLCEYAKGLYNWLKPADKLYDLRPPARASPRGAPSPIPEPTQAQKLESLRWMVEHDPDEGARQHAREQLRILEAH